MGQDMLDDGATLIASGTEDGNEFRHAFIEWLNVGERSQLVCENRFGLKEEFSADLESLLG
jgi:hypothetical protein